MTSHMSVTKLVYYDANTPGYNYSTALTDMGSTFEVNNFATHNF